MDVHVDWRKWTEKFNRGQMTYEGVNHQNSLLIGGGNFQLFNYELISAVEWYECLERIETIFNVK